MAEMMDISEFKSLPDFNSLKKDSVGQSYCHLNKLIKGKSPNDFDNVEKLVSTAETLSKFDDSLRLILIDSFHLTEHVINILLSQDNCQIKRILNCDWFYNVCPPERFFQDIFPHVSFVVRNQLLNKLAKKLTRSEDAERFMLFARDSYSREKAELFLPKCSLDFISKYIKESNPSFQQNKSCTVLLLISRKYPTIVLDLYSAWLQRNGGSRDILQRHKKVLCYLASNHTDEFVSFFQKNFSHLLFLSFGRGLSRKIGLKVKDTLLTSRQLMNSNVFNKAAVFKALSSEDQVKFLSAMVKFDRENLTFTNWINCRYDRNELLQMVKPQDRMQIIESTFKQVYNLELKDHIMMLSPVTLELVPEKLRVPYVSAYERAITSNIQENNTCRFYEGLQYWQPAQNPEDYVYLYSYDVAFARLKEALSKAPSVYRRQDIMRAMIRNCIINRDVDNLKKLIEYVSVRFRNDTSQTYIQFLKEMFDMLRLETLDSVVVQKAEEMLHLCFVKNERHNYEYLMEKCMTHRLSKNLDVEPQVRQIVDWCIADRRLGHRFIQDFSGKQSRQLFFKFYSEALKRIQANPELSESVSEWVILTLWLYNGNRRTKRDSHISFANIAEIVPHIKAVARKRANGILDEFDMVEGLERHYGLIVALKSRSEIFLEVLKRKPEVIVNKLDAFFEYLINDYHVVAVRNLFRFSIKVFSFLGVMERVKGVLLEKFRNITTQVAKVNALMMYSQICNLEEFEMAVRDYLPKGETVDTTADPVSAYVQLLLPGFIKFVQPSWRNMDLILKFFVGDFFCYVRVSFYKCCYWTRVDGLIPRLLTYLKSLPENHRISIKKEVIRTLLQVSSFHEAVDVCRNWWDAISHHSIRSVLFKWTSGAFLERPTRELFALIEKFIWESEEIVLDSRPKVGAVPGDFFHDYVCLLWKYSETQSPSFKTILRRDVISGVSEHNIRLLPDGFCEALIDEYLFGCELDVKSFASLYLMSDVASVPAKLQFILKVYKRSNANLAKFSDFLKTLRRASLNELNAGSRIIGELLKNWPYADNNTILYDENVLLSYYCLYHKVFAGSDGTTATENAERFGRELKTFYLCQQNLDHLIPVYLDTLKTFLGEVSSPKRELDSLAMFKEMLESHTNVGLAILVVLNLPEDKIKLYQSDDSSFDPNDMKTREEMAKILHLLKQHQNQVVQIYLNRRFKSC